MTTGELILQAAACLVVEDAHRIDAASAEVLRFVGQRIGKGDGAVLVTFRDELTADHPLWPAGRCPWCWP